MLIWRVILFAFSITLSLGKKKICPDGWYKCGELCIIHGRNRERLTWRSANEKCKQKGSGVTLTNAKTKEIWNRVAYEFKRSGGSGWIGLSARKDRDFTWMDGERLGYHQWNPGHPYLDRLIDRCVVMHNGKIDDSHCNDYKAKYSYSCSFNHTETKLPPRRIRNDTTCPTGWRLSLDKKTCLITPKSYSMMQNSILGAKQNCRALDSQGKLIDFTRSLRADVIAMAAGKKMSFWHTSSGPFCYILDVYHQRTAIRPVPCRGVRCYSILCQRPPCKSPCRKGAILHNNKCYERSLHRIPYAYTLFECQRLHQRARLVTIDNLEDNDLFMVIGAPSGAMNTTDRVWIGLERSSENDCWKWKAHSKWTFDNFRPRVNKGVFGVLNLMSGEWEGVPNKHSIEYHAICEYPAC